VAQIPNSHLLVNVNDVTVFVDSRNIYTSDHPPLFGVGVPHPADCLLCFSTVSPLRIDKKNPDDSKCVHEAPPVLCFFFRKPFSVQYRHGGAVMGAVRGNSCSFWFLGFRCWVIRDRKREEDSRWKGNGNNQGRKEWTHGVFFWGKASSARSLVVVVFVF